LSIPSIVASLIDLFVLFHSIVLIGRRLQTRKVVWFLALAVIASTMSLAIETQLALNSFNLAIIPLETIRILWDMQRAAAGLVFVSACASMILRQKSH
jgi:hypothetical protein